MIPFDAWYIVPARSLPTGNGFGVYPHVRRSRGRYERFREAWPLLMETHCAESRG